MRPSPPSVVAAIYTASVVVNIGCITGRLRWYAAASRATVSRDSSAGEVDVVAIVPDVDDVET